MEQSYRLLHDVFSLYSNGLSPSVTHTKSATANTVGKFIIVVTVFRKEQKFLLLTDRFTAFSTPIFYHIQTDWKTNLTHYI